MKANKIVIGAEDAPLFEFDNSSIDATSINFSTAVDIVGAELSIDVFNVTVRYPPDIAELFSPADYDGILTADGMLFATNRTFGDLRTAPYATIVRFWHDGILSGKYYLRNVDRISRDAYRITAMSAIGVLDTQQHYGGLFVGERFDSVLAGIIGGSIPYSVEEDLAALPVFGWLPIDTKRRNLHRLLLAEGATLTKSANGDIVFAFLVASNTPEEIPSSKIYYGGSVDYNAPATAVEVIEHTFYITGADESVSLFDNQTAGEPAVGVFVKFNEPMHDLTADGTLAIDSSGVNYAIVSGTGTLTGKRYTHTRRLVRKEVANSNGTEKVVALDDSVCLVNTLNSENVAERLLAYYSSAKTVKASIVYAGEQAGRQIAFTDPYNDESTGFVESMDVTVSGVAKANCRIVTDFVPTGQGNGYSNAELLTGTGTWTVPDGITEVKAFIGGAGHGGYQGSPGEAGTNSKGGAGGGGGQGGEGGKLLTVTIPVTPGDTIPFACGAGGNPGADGGDTTFGTHTSADGAVAASGWINVFSGAIYGQRGENGYYGGVGASQSNPFEYIDYRGVRYMCGDKGADINGYQNICYGGFGGGAAVGVDGGNGFTGGAVWRQGVYQGDYGGAGGIGATPIAADDATVYCCGGQGGHGGGGGGVGGTAAANQYAYQGSPGVGGSGGLGGHGADGCIILYY